MFDTSNAGMHLKFRSSKNGVGKRDAGALWFIFKLSRQFISNPKGPWGPLHLSWFLAVGPFNTWLI